MRIPPAARRVLDPLTERCPVPIITGPNRGRWWSAVSAGSGYASGRRAREQMELFGSLMSPGDCVWDIGAHHGYVTLLASARVGPTGAVVAFEPDRRNGRILLRHVRWNRARNVDVRHCALSDFTGTAPFGGGPTSKMHSLGDGCETVTVCSGASLVTSGQLRAPTVVKIDAEGAEGSVVAGMLSVLPADVVLLIAMHHASADRHCVEQLTDAGFRLLPSPALTRARRADWRGDPDLLCLGPGFRDDGRVQRVIAAGLFDAAESGTGAR